MKLLQQYILCLYIFKSSGKIFLIAVPCASLVSTAVGLHLFGTSNFIGPGWGAPLLLLGLGYIVLLFFLLFFLANPVRRYIKMQVCPSAKGRLRTRDPFTPLRRAWEEAGLCYSFLFSILQNETLFSSWIIADFGYSWEWEGEGTQSNKCFLVSGVGSYTLCN